MTSILDLTLFGSISQQIPEVYYLLSLKELD